jgi:hypothetical protein
MRPSNVVIRLVMGIGLMFAFLLGIGLLLQILPDRPEPGEVRQDNFSIPKQ